MTYRDVQVIAEVKLKSPYGFEATHTTFDTLFSIADEIGDMISIHTNPAFGGSYAMLTEARKRTKKPILAKDFNYRDDDIRRAVDLGADCVLVVGRIPCVHLDRCIIEPYTLAELIDIPRTSFTVWNARDLRNGKPKSETFEEARGLRQGWLCQASFIRSVEDIKPGADAVLVGSYLENFARSLSSNIRYRNCL